MATIQININSLLNDLNDVLREDRRMSSDGLGTLNKRFNELFKRRLGEPKEVFSGLSMSNFGSSCSRKLWYAVNTPELAEPLLPHTRLKFLYGDIIEELLLALVEEAGHSVEGRQDTLDLYGIPGHRDAVIDGMTIDVKSANSRQFLKFSRSLDDLKKDLFFPTYLIQLQMYMEAAVNDPLVSIKKVGGFLALDQELGHVKLRLIPKENTDWKTKIEEKKGLVSKAEPPVRPFKDVDDGMSGNKKLPVICSYCPYKKKCWPGVRTFISSSGPKHLTVVKREPNMVEVK